GEVLTGDLPTPIKYFSTEIAAAYKKVEAEAEKKLLSLLPTDLTKEFEAYVRPNKAGYEYKLVKCADKITAYIKCIEELKGQNKEFKSAHDSIKKDLNQMAKDVPCVKYFLDNFVDAFYKTLDELA
ncbi:MAG: 5'-deoxynucleotidase, partial [Firmicutes bacterium]|nr:5'-deoxynucleotidase [Bacillota bacterium]